MSAIDERVVGPEPMGNGAGRVTARPRPRRGSFDRVSDELVPSSVGIAESDDPRVIAALETYLEALRKGRPWSRSELLARYPDISGALDGYFLGLDFIEGAVAELSCSSGEPAKRRAEPALPPQSRLGDYHILREVGRGGMGVVYEAEQLCLGRRVALKVLPFTAALNPEHRQRFQIEAHAAAQLHHPHIVPIFGVGCENGIHYYAMQFIDGHSLAAIIRDLRSGEQGFLSSGEKPAKGASVDAEESTRTINGTPGDGESSVEPIEAEGNRLRDESSMMTRFRRCMMCLPHLSRMRSFPDRRVRIGPSSGPLPAWVSKPPTRSSTPMPSAFSTATSSPPTS